MMPDILQMLTYTSIGGLLVYFFNNQQTKTRKVEKNEANENVPEYIVKKKPNTEEIPPPLFKNNSIKYKNPNSIMLNESTLPEIKFARGYKKRRKFVSF